jgi:hypothetical protein
LHPTRREFIGDNPEAKVLRTPPGVNS